MNKDEALDLALETLEALNKHGDIACVVTPEREFRLPEVITAIKQARSAPVQDKCFLCGERVESCTSTVCPKATPPAAPVQDVSLIDEGKTAAPVQEPVAWKWHQAPVKTQWGDDMVVADIAIDKDHTVSIYCERDQAAKVEAMFSAPAAQRQWVGLTGDEIVNMLPDDDTPMSLGEAFFKFAELVEAKLKAKNFA
jgi:hypothetical protein